MRNPKQENTCLYDCIPQSGKCSIGCNQCFFNRDNAFYTEVPYVPANVPRGAIVRMNSGNDSNNQRALVVKAAELYDDAFYNTSVPILDFPGPVVFTANPKEEEMAKLVYPCPDNLMFVRLRVSATNIGFIDAAVDYYTGQDVPVVLTFMAYYTDKPAVSEMFNDIVCYEWRVRHINSYWCPTAMFKSAVLKRYQWTRLVSLCGNWCKDCRNCETYYWQTKKRMRGE